MTIRQTPLGDVVTTKFTKKQNELGVEENWEEVTLEKPPHISNTQRLRLMTAREIGKAWPQ